MAKVTHEFDLYGKHYVLETGELAKQATGSCLVKCGDSTVLLTAVVSKERKDYDFFPLTVDFIEKMYAVGRIPGGYLKREARPSEKATLTARMIDRPLRPSFPAGFRNDHMHHGGIRGPHRWRRALRGPACVRAHRPRP